MGIFLFTFLVSVVLVVREGRREIVDDDQVARGGYEQIRQRLPGSSHDIDLDIPESLQRGTFS
jgi:hypothetical protein